VINHTNTNDRLLTIRGFRLIFGLEYTGIPAAGIPAEALGLILYLLI
jgi:hypothetical protein